jgi:hypothetical protein
MFTECGNGLQHLEPSTKWKTQLTQMIFREVGQDALVYLVLAEYRLILFEAKAPQPDDDVHNSAPNSGLLHIIVRPGESVQEASR